MQKFKKILMVAKNCGTVFNTNIAIATANGFLKQGRWKYDERWKNELPFSGKTMGTKSFLLYGVG